MAMKSAACKTILLFCMVGLVGSTMTGCASPSIPSDQYGQPRETIRAATEMGTEDNPEAQLHLKLAEEELVKADKFIKQEKKNRAELALLRAEADASLALSLLKRDDARIEVEEIQAKIDELRKETQQLEGTS
jgi:hypothetical protein